MRLSGSRARPTRGRGERRALLVLLGIFAVLVIGVLLIDEPLGHDESVYATWARSWLSGQSRDAVVSDHRAPALPLIALPIVALTGAEPVLRGVGLVFGVLALVALWALGRRLGGAAAGLLAAGVFGSSWTIIDASALLLTDLPAAAALLLALLACQRGLAGARPVGALVWAAPLWALAIYLRFGSALPVLLTIVGVAVLHRHRIAAQPRLPLLTAALFALLMAPLAVAGIVAFGTPWGYLTTTTTAAGRAFLGEGLLYYLRALPLALAGPLTAVVVLLGLAAPWLVPRGDLALRAVLRLLAAVAVADVVLIGLVAHGEARFVFFPIGLLVLSGSIAVVSLARRAAGSEARARRLRPLAAGLLAASLVVGTAAAAYSRLNLEDSLAGVRAAGRTLERQHHGECTVATSYGPQIAWYSGCDVAALDGGADAVAARLRDVPRYVYLVEEGKRQPTGVELTSLLEGLGARQVNTFGHGTSRLYRVP